MIIDQLVFRFFSYIVYFWKAQSDLYIHSPFIFNWVNAIRQNQGVNNKAISQYRDILNKDSSPLYYTLRDKEVCVTVSDRYRKTSISDYYGKILASTFKYLESTRFLELGTSLGVSTAYIVGANPAIIGVTIDANLQATIKSKDLSNRIFPNNQLDFQNGYFKEILPIVFQKNNQFDFVFIDGDHSFTSTIDYVNQILPFLSDKSVIVLDDIRWSRDMFRAWEELIQLPEFNYTVDFGRIGFLFKINNHSLKQHFYLH